MAIKISQGLKQQQSLAMTPQLQQAIKLLTLTHLEMTNVIAEELVENPMLEEYETSSESEGEDMSTAESDIVEAKAEDFSEAPILKDKDDFDWESYAESYNNHSSTPNMVTAQDSEDFPSYENIVSKSMTLSEHLEWQLKMSDLPISDFDFAMQIIGNINDDGYLEVKLEELALENKVELCDALEILEVIQSLDPIGCGASNLIECLLAQAKISYERSPLLEVVIREHLEDLQTKSFDKIAKKLGVTIAQIKNIALIIQSYHPRPGRLVAPQDTHYIMPDIYVVQVAGEFVVQVNDDGVPRLKISKLYQDLLIRGKKDADQEFVKDKLRSAEWLIKSIQNRQRTIEKVAKSIIQKQQEFFKKGPKFLKPMVLKDVAQEIGMHESTVSRVTSNKYMHSPIGVFELKYFFNTGLGGKGGSEDIASEVLKLKIKTIFEAENPKRPFSDQKVVEILARDGHAVARRTVTKYREILGILSSSKRKEGA